MEISILLFLLLYLFNSFTDLKSGYVYSTLTLSMLVLSFISSHSNITCFETLSGIFIFICLFLLDRNEKYIGRGDIPIIISSFIVLGEKSYFFITTSCILTILYSLVFSKKEVRFVPFLFTGFIFCYFI